MKRLDFKSSGTIWSPFISVGVSRQLGNMCSTSDGHAIVSYILSNICYVAFADSISAVLQGIAPFGGDVVVKTGVLGKTGQPAEVSINNIDSKLHMVIYYYDSAADNFRAEFWLDSTGLGDSFVFVSFINVISATLTGLGVTTFYGPAIIPYIIKSSGGNLIVLLPYITSYYGLAYYTMQSYYSSNGGLSWTLGGSASCGYQNLYWGGNLFELSDGSIMTCKYGGGGIVVWSNSGTTNLGGYSWINFPDILHMYAPGIVKNLAGEIFLYTYDRIFRYIGPSMETIQNIRDGNNWTIIHSGQTTSSITLRGLLCDNIIVIQIVQDITHGNYYAGSDLTWQTTRIRNTRHLSDTKFIRNKHDSYLKPDETWGRINT